MKSLKSTCGFPNSSWIYFIGFASFVEAIIFTYTYGVLVADINRRFGGPWIHSNSTPLRLAIFLLIISCIRIVVAVALVAGCYRKMLNTLAFFVMFTMTGIISNIIVGTMILDYRISYNIGVATLSIIALHIIYALIATIIYRKERKISTDGPVIQTAVVIQRAAAPTPIAPNTRYIAGLPVLNTPYIQEVPVNDPHMPPPLSPPVYSERDAGNSSYTVESEANPKQTTVLK